MRIHLIAIGGSAMHNLALALQCNHHTVTGSDDEIYNPARDRLAQNDLLPTQMGWDADRITPDIDLVILGMHARADNPELLKAQALGLNIFSYPAFLYEHARQKTRVVVAGSHGKTTTTAMIMHVLRHHKIDFDYLVGAQLEGFNHMVRLSDAPVMVIEGDEYLSSAIDRRPKFLHYHPHIAIVTGIAWDHINVFPSFEEYVGQFEAFLTTIEPEGQLFHYAHDGVLNNLVESANNGFHKMEYQAFPHRISEGKVILQWPGCNDTSLKIFGQHNLENLMAAFMVCQQLDIDPPAFLDAIASFSGAAKRLQLLAKNANGAEVFQDFAHAPSKVKATTEAMRSRVGDGELVACLELHTFSSLNRKFLSQYKDSLDAADRAYVYFSEHTLKMKRLELLNKEEVKAAFNHPKLEVFTNNQALVEVLNQDNWHDAKLLLMSSGTFSGLDMKELARELMID